LFRHLLCGNTSPLSSHSLNMLRLRV
jgi:hypothetical protein